ncbi:MAG: hypothetical protein WCL21_17590 [Mariniphaga sp.]
MPNLRILLVFLLLFSKWPAVAQPTSIRVDKRIANGNTDTINVNYLNQQCWSLRATNPKSAIAIGLESLKMAQIIEFNKGVAQAMNYLGICYLRLGDSPTASHYFFKTLSFADSLNLTTLVSINNC